MEYACIKVFIVSWDSVAVVRLFVCGCVILIEKYNIFIARGHLLEYPVNGSRVL